MTFALQVTLGDEQFTLAHISVQDMVKVKSWTGLKNRDEWAAAIGEEDPEALIAAYVLAKQRKGENLRFTDADFDLDSLEAAWVDDTGRRVEPLFEKNPDGSYRLNDKRLPIPVLDKTGAATWVFTDTGDPVPPTTVDSEPTSPTPVKPGNSSESDSGIPTT